MKKLICTMLVLSLALAGCAGIGGETTVPSDPQAFPTLPEKLEVKSSDYVLHEGETLIRLSDEEILIDVEKSRNPDAVYVGRDIVYYEAGRGITYGAGGPEDGHTPEEAADHQVVHITQPGTYVITGKLSAGQIAVDLGEKARQNPHAVVTLILDGVDITCTVAPAIIFYNVYECGPAEERLAAPSVDTTAAGANLVIAGGSVNVVNGSYVAKIYKEGTVILDRDGYAVEKAGKLHKYDAAVYSRMSMNVDGEGVLVVNAENEGLGTELHLTINGGDIRIFSGNDGINTNADNVSVTTINGGNLEILVTGETGEGDGIDSNGWILVNGGSVNAAACGVSMDAGLDADRGIFLNGGRVIASGNMLDRIAEGGMNYTVFRVRGANSGVYTLKNEGGDTVLSCTAGNDFTCLLVANAELVPGTYSLWEGDHMLARMIANSDGPGLLPERPDFPPPEGDYEIPPQPTRPVERE